jgi:hypothetical protein
MMIMIAFAATSNLGGGVWWVIKVGGERGEHCTVILTVVGTLSVFSL